MDGKDPQRTDIKSMNNGVSVPGALAVLAAALCFGAIPVIAINAYNGGVNVLTLLSLRYIIASAITVPALRLVFKARFPARKQALKVMLASSVLMGLEAALYFYSLKRLPVSLASLLLFTFPILVYAVELCMGRSKFSTRSGLALLGSLVGLALMLGVNAGSVDVIGVICALLASSAYAVYLVLIDRWGKGVHAAAINALVSVGNAAVLTAAALASGSFTLHFSNEAWLYVILLVIVSNLIGFIAFYRGLTLLGPTLTSALNMSEPFFAAVLSWVLLGQNMNLVEITGGVIVLAGIIAFSLHKSNTKV